VTAGARSGSWRPHGTLLLVLVLQAAAFGCLHRSRERLEADAAAGETSERIAALHILTNRGAVDPDRFGEDFGLGLLAEEDPRMREYAFTSDVCNVVSPQVHYRYLKGRMDAIDGHWWRSFVIHRRKIGVGVGGSSARITLQELEWYFDSLAGRPLPADELLRYQEANP